MVQTAQCAILFWWTGKDTQPADLGERLVAHGFSVFEQDAPAMAENINKLNWEDPRPPDLQLKPIENDEQLLQWKHELGFLSFHFKTWDTRCPLQPLQGSIQQIDHCQVHNRNRKVGTNGVICLRGDGFGFCHQFRDSDQKDDCCRL